MARTRNAAAQDMNAATENTAAQDAATENTAAQDAATENTAAQDNATDPNYPHYAALTLTVEPIEGVDVPAVTVELVRFEKDRFEARVGDNAPSEAKTAQAAVNKALTAAKLKPTNYVKTVDEQVKEQAPIVKTAGANVPEGITEGLIDSILSDGKEAVGFIVDGAKGIGRSEVEGRDSWVQFGQGITALRSVFLKESSDQSKAAWGKVLHKLAKDSGSDVVAKRIESDNAVGQARFMATAPSEVLEAMGAFTASTFEKNFNRVKSQLVGAFAEYCAGEAGKEEGGEAGAAKLCRADVSTQEVIDGFDLITAYAQRAYDAAAAAFDKQNALVATAEQTDNGATDVQKSTLKDLRNARKEARLMLWTVLSGHDTVMVDGVAKCGSEVPSAGFRVLKSLVTALQNEAKPKPAPVEEKTESEEEVRDRVVAEEQRKFDKLSVENAAQHLLTILVSHSEREAILDALNTKLDVWLDGQEGVDETA